MKRSHIAWFALLALLLLTGGSLLVSEQEAGPWPVAALALVKAAIICAVFLELDRAWPGWAVIAGLVLTAIAGGAALLITA